MGESPSPTGIHSLVKEAIKLSTSSKFAIPELIAMIFQRPAA
jgi:hypothetical protein